MTKLLASLEKLIIQLRQKKQDAAKLRQKTEIQIKEASSAERRSSSGLQSIDKKIESEREESSGVSTVLIRKNSQLESIGRLIDTAEERLSREKETIEQTKQEIEFADSPEEKQNAEARLRSLNDHVQELVSEIKSRQKTAKKISDDVTNYSDIKSKIGSKIQKQTKSKPPLRETKSTSHKSIQILTKELEKQTKAEESAKKSLDAALSKFQELAKKRKPAKKTAAKRKPAKKTAAKRKPAKKTAAKRKPAKKTAA
ncbi:MAG: ATPase V, partial [Nitrosopumilus sp.]|nr:ATPase V [Nitrosopumilus sp.]